MSCRPSMNEYTRNYDWESGIAFEMMLVLYKHRKL